MTWYWQVFLRLNAVSHVVRLQSKDCDFSSENRINFWHAMGDQFLFSQKLLELCRDKFRVFLFGSFA